MFSLLDSYSLTVTVLQMYLPETVLVADGDTWEFNLFHIFYLHSYVSFILKENRDSVSHLSNKENDGRSKGTKPQNSVNKSFKWTYKKMSESNLPIVDPIGSKLKVPRPETWVNVPRLEKADTPRIKVIFSTIFPQQSRFSCFISHSLWLWFLTANW